MIDFFTYFCTPEKPRLSLPDTTATGKERACRKTQPVKTNRRMFSVYINITVINMPQTAKQTEDNANGGTTHSPAQTPETAPGSTSFSDFVEKTAAQMREMGKTRTAETYLTALNRFRHFRSDITLGEINRDIMEAYETHLRHSGLMPNTIAFYMRTLRAAYNRAVEKGLTPDNHPFAKLHTGLGKTEKRAVSADNLRRLAAYKPASAEEEFARDMFLFSFYTRGMAWIDMANLRKSDIRNGQLIYCRRKTGQRLAMKWDKRMQAIADKYPGQDGYLLPIITKQNGKERNQLRYCLNKTNIRLKEMSEKLRLERSLTMYVARHSWASIARTIGIPTHIISGGMGHNSEKTTLIYMKDLDSSAIDDANQRIMNLIG